MKYILSIDQGTTGTRAILFDKQLAPLCTSYKEHTQYYPQSGWIEHDPEQIWQCVVDVTQQTLDKAKQCGIRIQDIEAAGIANQGETVMLWDSETGKPYYNAIVWQCRRTSDYAKKLAQIPGFAESVTAKTGLIVDAYFSATKIKWLLENVPETKVALGRGTLRAGTLDTYLIFKMTGGKSFVTDVSTASRTMLFNIHTLEWDDEILKTLEIPRSILAEVKPTSADFGTTDKSFCGLTIPIGGSVVDQQGALFGQGCFHKGDTKCTYGTGCFMLMNTGDKPVYSSNGLLTTVAWQVGDHVAYALDGGIYIAGAAFQWLRDSMHFILEYDEIDRICTSLPGNDGVYFVTAFSGLAAPYWDPYARGTIVGITSHTRVAHMVRATTESIAFQVNNVLDCMIADSGLDLPALNVDGGATKSRFLMQFQADIINRPVRVSKNSELTATGAAMFAGLYAGWWSSPEALFDLQKDFALFSPSMPPGQRASLRSDWDMAVERSMGWHNRTSK